MKKRIFSSLLVLALLLALLPTTVMAASFPPADSNYWTNVSDSEACQMLVPLPKSGYLVFIFFGTDCPRSARQVPEMADFLDEAEIQTYAFSCATGEPSQVAYVLSQMFGTLPAWPVVVMYNADTGKCGAYGNCDLEHLKEGLQTYGIYDGSDRSDSDSTGSSGSSSLPLYFDSDIDSASWEVLRLTNQHRMSMGLDPLSTTDSLQMAANQRAVELTIAYYSDHSRPDGSACFTVLEDYSIAYNMAAENIAYGYATAAAVMNGWLNSSGHRANIENGSLIHLGVGRASSYWAQDFISSSSCSYSGLSLSQSRVTGQVGQDLEDILTDADVTVTANCAQHGTSYLPLIAAMCSGYDADTAGTQTITVKLDGKKTSLTVTLTGDSTVPDNTTPGSTVPDSTTPDSTTPDNTTPDNTTPDNTTPGSTTPDSTAPDSTAPGNGGQTTTPPTTQQPAAVLTGGGTGMVGQTNTLAAGMYHNGMIDENGTLWMWGFGSFGRLGTGTAEDSLAPVKVLDNVASVDCGWNCTAAIKTDGTLWMWGYNNDGELGNNGEGNQILEGKTCQTVPVKVLDNVAAVSCGHYHNAAIKTDGTLWVWGSNFSGQLGNGTTESSWIPVKVLDNVAAVCCGEYYTAAIRTDGTLWMWGDNTCGQLGNGGEGDYYVVDVFGSEEVYQTVPVKVLDNVAFVNCGADFTAAVKTDGTLWTWGNNEYGQLGTGTTENSLVPVKVLDNVAAVSGGMKHTAAIKTDGTLWAWGRNWWGQLGIGVFDSAVPLKVLDSVAAVSCGANYTAAIKTDGTLWTWGYGKNGQLGIGKAVDTQAITQVTGLTAKLPERVGQTPSTPAAPTASDIAYATTYSILVDGKPVAFDAYALKDENGYDTNYLKLRDVAYVLNGTAAPFNVDWDAASGSITVTTRMRYMTPNGSEMSTPFSGNQPYTNNTSAILVNGVKVALSAITLTDANGGGYTYFKLRDLGQYLGFDVDWDAASGSIVIDTTRPYSA